MTVPDDLERYLVELDGGLPDPEDLRFAAVAVLLLRASDGDRDPRLLLTERSRALRHHAGQVSFPGGKPEPDDTSLLATALRESHEEVGLPRSGTRVLGRLSPVPTPSGFLIVPFVGWGPVGWSPTTMSAEVHRVLTPHLRTLVEPGVHQVAGTDTWKDRPYPMHEYHVHDPPVRGATAWMVHELLGRIGRASAGR